MKKYSDKLKDPRWQKKRLEILHRDGWECQHCYSKDNTLHVHHKKYFFDKEPWEIENKFLVTLCEECHEREREAVKDYAHDLIVVLKDKGFGGDDFHHFAHSIDNLNDEQFNEILAIIQRKLCQE